MAGIVYLVGAGPGDEGLITEKGKICIQKADVILYDRLVNPRLLEYAKASCEFVYCGKLPKNHTIRQERINSLLVEYAQTGKTVVRLKGGDPSVFGRVGEEAEELAKHHIAFEIVPGVTSSIAAAAYAGIPVTHREYSNTFTLSTGHCKRNNVEQELDFAALSKSKTAAFYMGIQNLGSICEQLILHGKNPHTPVAIIEWGTTGKQKTAVGTLQTIVEQVHANGISNPAMTIVGEVVNLREALLWFEKKPLHGKKVLVAKATAQSSKTAAMLREYGAEAWEVPHLVLENIPLSQTDAASAVVAERLVFCAKESVGAFMEAVFATGMDARHLPLRIEAANEECLIALAGNGIRASLAKQSAYETVYIGHEGQADITKLYGDGKMLVTSRIRTDYRFDEPTSRLLQETAWDTVFFESTEAVALFAAEMERFCASTDKLKYACLNEETEQAARQSGFTVKDEEFIQFVRQQAVSV